MVCWFLGKILSFANFRHTEGEWNCEACQNGVSAFGMFYANNDVINSLTENLQGQYFCEDPEMGFTEDQAKECAENMSIFMPPALNLDWLIDRSDDQID